MKMQTHQRWLAGALCAALAACSNMDSNRSTASTDSSSETSSMASTGDSSMPGSTSSASTPAASSSAISNSGSTTAQVTYGTVQSVDSMQRQDVGVGTLGAAAAGGSMGAPTDRVYRVAVRMDDGTTQTIVVDTKPSYKSGDRVRYSNGALERY